MPDISQLLYERIEELSGPIPPPQTDGALWMPMGLMELNQILGGNAGSAFHLFIAQWISGKRILPAYAGPGYSRSNKLGVYALSRAGLIVYDKIRDVAVLDEQAVLDLLNREFAHEIPFASKKNGISKDQ